MSAHVAASFDSNETPCSPMKANLAMRARPFVHVSV
jgi:hypothetical protein